MTIALGISLKSGHIGLIAALFTIAGHGSNRWVDKEVVVHIFNRILLNYKKEHIWGSSNEVESVLHGTCQILLNVWVGKVT